MQCRSDNQKDRPCQAELRFRVQYVKPVIDAGFRTQESVKVGHGLNVPGNEWLS
jgi:hypothetical protein